MKIVYRYYEPNQGLEDIQAKIYTEVSGLPATAAQIRERNLRRDPKITRYALTEEGKPLAYVTARDSGSHVGRTYIGYPWALPDCPLEVQQKIFDELIAYLKTREKTLEIATTIVVTAKIAEEQIKFFQKRGFVEKERLYRYILDYDVNEVSQWEMTDELSSFTSRVATIDDLDLLIEVCQADPYTQNAFPNEEGFRSYFKDRVFKDGHAVLVLQGEQAVAASAVLKRKPDGIYLTGDEERVTMRFSAIRPGHPQAWKRLLIEIAKECQTAGWANILLRVNFFFNTGSPIAAYMATMQPELELFEIIFVSQTLS
ncbi:MAG: hypothetical protein ACFFC7_13095 [Candidatus Hermodarchaeota archaeon]